MKPFLIASLAFSMITLVDARDKEQPPPPGQQQPDKGKEKAKEKEKAKDAREARRKAIQEVLDLKDKNHDGSLSKDEYLAGEADAEAAGKKFDEFNKNKDRFLSKAEIGDMLGV